MQHPLTSNPALDNGPAPLFTYTGDYLTHLIAAIFLGVCGLGFTGYELWNQDFLVIWFGLLLLAGATVAFVRYQMIRNRVISLYQNGFSVSNGRSNEFARWEEVESFHQKIVKHSVNFIPTGTTYNYRVRLSNGKSWAFDNTIKRVEELGSNFQKAICHTQLPGLVESFKRGETVSFGGLSFNRAGISFGRTTIAWDEYKALDFSDGYLRVHKNKTSARGLLTGGTIVVHASGIPNLYMLVAFVKAIGKAA